MRAFSLITGGLALFLRARAREITFPPVAAISPQDIYGDQAPLFAVHSAADVDVRNAQPFTGLTTFANIPYVHCLSREEHVAPYDIAVLGAPFDTAVTSRPGARFGPHGIRWGSRRIEAACGTSIYDGRNPFTDWAAVVDCGDAPLTFLDNTVALKQLDQAHRIISSRPASNSTYRTPRIITLGGDHTTTLSALRSTAQHWGRVSVIHFDSHIDTWDPAVLGGGISHYAGVNHGTFLHLAHEANLTLDSSIHAGIRAPIEDRGVRRHDRACGFGILTARDLDRWGVDGVVRRIRERVAGTRVYISVDIDVLDPAFAPATGTAEPGGWSSRELLAVLDGLDGLDVVGGDVVEVSPVYDTKGESTQLIAAEVARSILQLMVSTPVLPLSAQEE